MPINLNALELIPSTPYNVSISMKIGDKEIDSLRSFSSTTPPIFNKNLENYAPSSATITRVYNQTRAPREKSTESTITTFKIISVKAKLAGYNASGGSSSGWKGGGSLNQYAPMMRLSYKVNVDLKNAAITSINATKTGNKYVLDQLAGGRTTKKKIVTVDVPVTELGMTWSSIHKEWTGGIRGTKLFGGSKGKFSTDFSGTGVYGQSVEIPAVVGVYSLTSTLRTYVDPSISNSLVNGEEIKDVVYFLYSESTSNPPNESTYLYIDENFISASGVDTAVQRWSPASGTRFKENATYNFPAYSSEDISSRKTINQSLIDKIVFSNTSQRVDNSIGEINGTESDYPSTISIAFTVIRYTLNTDGSWSPSWIGGASKLSSPTSAVIT